MCYLNEVEEAGAREVAILLEGFEHSSIITHQDSTRWLHTASINKTVFGECVDVVSPQKPLHVGDMSVCSAIVLTHPLRTATQARNALNIVVSHNLGVVVCCVSFHPYNKTAETIDASIDPYTIWLQFVIGIHVPKSIRSFSAVLSVPKILRPSKAHTLRIN